MCVICPNIREMDVRTGVKKSLGRTLNRLQSNEVTKFPKIDLVMVTIYGPKRPQTIYLERIIESVKVHPPHPPHPPPPHPPTPPPPTPPPTPHPTPTPPPHPPTPPPPPPPPPLPLPPPPPHPPLPLPPPPSFWIKNIKYKSLSNY